MSNFNTVTTGLSATRSRPTTPDMTFRWDVRISRDERAIEAFCKYGIKTNANGQASALIPIGNTDDIALAITHPVDGIAIRGTVNAIWLPSAPGFILMYSGNMVRSGVNNVISADLNGVDSAKIIVAVGGVALQ